MKRRYIRRSTSLAIAISAHVAFVWAATHKEEFGKTVGGESGLQIDLGMIGDMGGDEATQLALQEMNIEWKPEWKLPKLDAPEPLLKQEIKESKELDEPLTELPSFDNPDIAESRFEERLPKPELEIEPEVAPEPSKVEKPVESAIDKPVLETSKELDELLTELPSFDNPDIAESRFEETLPKPELEIEPEVAPEPSKVEKPVESAIDKPVLETSKDQTDSDALSNSLAKTTGSDESEFSGGKSGITSDYEAMILAILQHNKLYPRDARRRKQEGTAILEFVISSNGTLLEYQMIKSSGHKRLDDSVIKMLQASAPFPAFASGLSATLMRFQIPVSFKLDS